MKRIIALVASLAFGFSVLFTALPALAATDASKQAACEAIGGKYDAGSGVCNDGSSGSVQPQDLMAKIINIFSWVVGAISVIMLIFGGFKYITSGGDSGKITSAKNTIIYALVGLVIVALSQVIVNFVLTKAIDASKPTAYAVQNNT